MAHPDPVQVRHGSGEGRHHRGGLVDIRSDVAVAPTTRDIDANSIAVMPLESLSPDPTDAILAAGLVLA